MLNEAERAQAPLIDWLQRHLAAATGAAVKRIDTQGAIVLLSGQEAWKLRRAIRLPFLDYSTPEKRGAAAQAEIRLNRDAAPGIYRDAVAITRDGASFTLGGTGEPVDWITRMSRFDEEATLDRLAERGELTPALIADLARAISLSHARAEVRDPGPAAAALEGWIAQNRAAFAEHADLFAAAEVRRLDVATRAAFDRAKPLLLSRANHCRRCHGDLHLRNIAFIDGKPTLFDAIEFDETIATGDVLYDVAFTLMDLWERDLHGAANALLNGYLTLGPEDHYEGLAALPLFLSVRAAIRAKVEAANRVHLARDARKVAEAAARRYFDFAQRFLVDQPARLVAIGGLSGSGKSALARALAPEVGRAPGAVWLASDVERKHMLGAQTNERLPVSAYDHETSARVYDRVRRRAGFALGAGHCAIVDMTHSWSAARSDTAALAGRCGVGFVGLWLEAPLGVRLARVSARRGDASDADASVASAQQAEPLTEPDWVALDASASLEALLEQARGHLAATSASAIGNSLRQARPRS